MGPFISRGLADLVGNCDIRELKQRRRQRRRRRLVKNEFIFFFREFVIVQICSVRQKKRARAKYAMAAFNIPSGNIKK